jgi:hypothetical protein
MIGGSVRDFHPQTAVMLVARYRACARRGQGHPSCWNDLLQFHHPGPVCRIVLYQEIDIAFRSQLASSRRSEHRKPPNMMSAAKPGEDQPVR